MATLFTTSPDEGPETRGEGKKEREKRKRQRQHDQDRRQSPNRNDGIDVCVGQAQAEVHSKIYSDIYLPLNVLAAICMAAYNPYQVRVEARGYSIR